MNTSIGRREFVKQGGAAIALAGMTTRASAAGEAITVGIPTARSSPVGVGDQRDWLNGATLAVDEINAAGGIGGHKLRCEIIDIDIMSPEGTVGAFQALTAKHVNAIASSFVLIPQPAMDAAAAVKVPYLHGNTSIASLKLVEANPVKYRNVFQIDAAETWYGSGFPLYLDAMIASGWKPKNNKIHIVQEQIAYTQVISKSLQQAIVASNGRWALGGITDIQFPVQDWSPVLRAVHQSEPGIIFIDHWVAAELASFAQQYADDPVKGSLVYLQYGPGQPEFLGLAGDAAQGMIWGTMIGVPTNDAGSKFRKVYQDRFGPNMGLIYTGAGYDTIKILEAAWKVTPPSDFDAVTKTIRKMSHRGVCGTYTFDRSTQSPLVFPWQTQDFDAGVADLLFQIQDGKSKIIGPSILAESKFRAPE